MENKKESSIVSTITNIGDKLGNVVTEFFMGKQPTKEEKELNAIRKERRLKLKLIQEDAQYEKDLELAEKGEYVPPFPVANDVKKKKDENIFANIGKHNPLEGFENKKSLGTTDFGIGKQRSGNSYKEPDFGLDGFAGSTNPMGNKRRRE